MDKKVFAFINISIFYILHCRNIHLFARNERYIPQQATIMCRRMIGCGFFKPKRIKSKRMSRHALSDRLEHVIPFFYNQDR